MDELRFAASRPLTLGIELELQLVRSRDGDLARDAGDLLRRLAGRKLPGEVKPEITESMIELNSPVHERCDALLADLNAMRQAVVEQAGVLNLGVCGGGAHPFHRWAERRIFPTDRFRWVLERYGYLAKQFTVFGQHIHVGCRDGDEAVYLVHMLTRHVPHFVALSAASPFYQGEETSFQSSRLTAVSAFPLAGHMPFVRDWAEFGAYFERVKAFGVVRSMKDFYWDIRPKPEYGTIEVRVCDTPLTIERAVLLAAYAQALSAYYLAERPVAPAQDVYLLNSHNRFEAMRYGLEGALIDPFTGARKRIGDDVLDTLALLSPHAAALGSAEALRDLSERVRAGESDAAWLRERAVARGSLTHAVKDACQRWRIG